MRTVKGEMPADLGDLYSAHSREGWCSPFIFWYSSCCPRSREQHLQGSLLPSVRMGCVCCILGVEQQGSCPHHLTPYLQFLRQGLMYPRLVLSTVEDRFDSLASVSPSALIIDLCMLQRYSTNRATHSTPNLALDDKAFEFPFCYIS